jgi:hypothetical protein
VKRRCGDIKGDMLDDRYGRRDFLTWGNRELGTIASKIMGTETKRTY